jgi:hypothetical protein
MSFISPKRSQVIESCIVLVLFHFRMVDSSLCFRRLHFPRATFLLFVAIIDIVISKLDTSETLVLDIAACDHELT